MTTFNFVGTPYPTTEQQESSKQKFLGRIGPHAEELDKGDGVVTFDYSYPPEDRRFISFGGNKDFDLPGFIARVNEYLGH